MIARMVGPNSYTGEDLVELHCHGNPHLLRDILVDLVAAGARPAEPGEFTFRAFRNGRMSLLQAESVADLIEAKGEWARKNALATLAEEGDRWVRELLDSLLEIWVPIEADLEFPTDDLDSLRLSDYTAPLQALLKKMRDLENRASRYSKLQEGYRVVLAGAPNVGKSSLLNALLGYNRALVTDIPGTTRDTLEEVFEIEGIPIRLVDTAGLGEARDTLDAAGMERSRDALARADLAVAILDLSLIGPPDESLTPSDFLPGGETSTSCPFILVGNKVDLLPQDSEWRRQNDLALVSAKEGAGLEDLINKMGQVLQDSGGVDLDERTMLNARQAKALGQASGALERALENIETCAPQELVATDLIDAKNALEELSGKSIRLDLMESIFSRFCIGK
jgi:tRNA modification GTPase